MTVIVFHYYRQLVCYLPWSGPVLVVPVVVGTLVDAGAAVVVTRGGVVTDRVVVVNTVVDPPEEKKMISF